MKEPEKEYSHEDNSDVQTSETEISESDNSNTESSKAENSETESSEIENSESETIELQNITEPENSELYNVNNKWNKITCFDPRDEDQFSCLHKKIMTATENISRLSYIPRERLKLVIFQAINREPGPTPAPREYVGEREEIRPIRERDPSQSQSNIVIPPEMAPPKLVSTFGIGGREYTRIEVDKGFVSARAIRDRNLRTRVMTPGGVNYDDPRYGTGFPLRFKPNETEFSCGHPNLPELWERRRRIVEERGDRFPVFGQEAKQQEAAAAIAAGLAEPQAPKMSTSAESMAPPTLGKAMSSDEMGH